ncbi:MAG: UTP--glucose-1-phosphate uridylyltransferase [Gammaproteobacteria bacterium RIFCSPHIGHO2_12_FULL_35_23]|nr:MAG: UTP--glucose-1-phosphate uridylyltransferase [Gammaproteobacteria bacterium RIFCSPHIGHO2_12_FULL_35_23]
MIRKAVFPVAGMGTRFLPATKASPKEMLPIVDKPLIQYAVEEAVKAGVTELIFITNSSKRPIEDHFDSNYELEHKLAERGKLDSLKLVKNILPEGISCVYVRQYETLGLGHAILCAKTVVGNEPFAVILADDLFVDEGKPTLKQMAEIYDQHQGGVIAVEEVADTTKYGIIEVEQRTGSIIQIKNIVEKPLPSIAPSNLGVAGRYILPPQIFTYLEKTKHDKTGEIQLTDAIAAMLTTEKIYAYCFAGKRYDCGDKLGYLKATVEMGLKHPELATAFAEYLQELLPVI